MLKELLKRDYVILDGAMGTNLFRKGLTAGECPESWNFENPEKIFEIHQASILPEKFPANIIQDIDFIFKSYKILP